MSWWLLREDSESRHRKIMSIQRYPMIAVSVEDTSDKPFRLLIKVNSEANTQQHWFATVAEAEAKAAEFRRNLDAAKEANKRIQEMIHGQL